MPDSGAVRSSPRGARGLLLGLAIGLLGAGVSCGAGAFVCESDLGCEGGGVGGRCEPDGFCSFPDDACESGRRYGALAGAGLGGRCVDDPGGTGGSSSSGSTGSTGSTSSSSSSTSSASTSAADTDGSTGLPIECGDGIVQAEEDCDDGNAVAADGCNPDCRWSGTLLWSDLHPGPGRALGIDGDGEQFVAVGYQDGARGRDALVRSYDRDGNVGFSTLVDREGTAEIAEAVVVAHGKIFVAGSRPFAGADGVVRSSWVARLGLDGDYEGEAIGPAGAVFAIEATEDGLVAGGYAGPDPTQGDAWLGWLDAGGALVDEQVSESGTFDNIAGLGLDPQGVPIAIGVRRGGGDQLYVDRITAQFSRIDELAAPFGSEGQGGCVAEDGRVVAVGYTIVDDVDDSVRAWLIRVYAPTDALLWEQSWDDGAFAGSDEIEAVTVDPAGDIIVAGFIATSAVDRDFMVRKYGPDGTERWTWRGSEGDGILRDVTTDTSGRIYVAGQIVPDDGMELSTWVGALSP